MGRGGVGVPCLAPVHGYVKAKAGRAGGTLRRVCVACTLVWTPDGGTRVVLAIPDTSPRVPVGQDWVSRAQTLEDLIVEARAPDSPARDSRQGGGVDVAGCLRRAAQLAEEGSGVWLSRQGLQRLAAASGWTSVREEQQYLVCHVPSDLASQTAPVFASCWCCWSGHLPICVPTNHHPDLRYAARTTATKRAMCVVCSPGAARRL